MTSITKYTSKAKQPTTPCSQLNNKLLNRD